MHRRSSLAESSDAPFLAALALDVRLAAVRWLRPGRTSAGSTSAGAASEVVASWTGASAAVADSAVAAASRAAAAAAAAFSASTKALGLRPRRCGRKAGSTTGTSLTSTGAAGSAGDMPSPDVERTEASVSSGGYLIGNLLGLSNRATACARCRLLRSAGRRQGSRAQTELQARSEPRPRARQHGGGRAPPEPRANLRQRTCLRDLIGNRRRGVSCNSALSARRAVVRRLGLVTSPSAAG